MVNEKIKNKPESTSVDFPNKNQGEPKMKKLLLSIVLMCTMLFAENQLDLARQKIDKAYNRNSKIEMLAARAMFERLLTTEQEKWLVNYYLAYCDYRLYIYEMQMENSKEAKAYINDGIDKLNRVLEENENFGEAYALMASFYGGKISLFPLSGMWNGPKSQKFMAEAYNYSSSSPRVHLLDGISKFTHQRNGAAVLQLRLCPLKKP